MSHQIIYFPQCMKYGGREAENLAEKSCKE